LSVCKAGIMDRDSNLWTAASSQIVCNWLFINLHIIRRCILKNWVSLVHWTLTTWKVRNRSAEVYTLLTYSGGTKFKLWLRIYVVFCLQRGKFRACSQVHGTLSLTPFASHYSLSPDHSTPYSLSYVTAFLTQFLRANSDPRNVKGRIIEGRYFIWHYLLSFPTPTPPSLWAFGWVGYVNTITEPIGCDKR